MKIEQVLERYAQFKNFNKNKSWKEIDWSKIKWTISTPSNTDNSYYYTWNPNPRDYAAGRTRYTSYAGWGRTEQEDQAIDISEQVAEFIQYENSNRARASAWHELSVRENTIVKISYGNYTYFCRIDRVWFNNNRAIFNYDLIVIRTEPIPTPLYQPFEDPGDLPF